MSDTQTFSVELEQREGFEFDVRFDWPGVSETESRPGAR